MYLIVFAYICNTLYNILACFSFCIDLYIWFTVHKAWINVGKTQIRSVMKKTGTELMHTYSGLVRIKTKLYIELNDDD